MFVMKRNTRLKCNDRRTSSNIYKHQMAAIKIHGYEKEGLRKGLEKGVHYPQYLYTYL